MPTPSTLKDVLNSANPSTLPDALRKLGFGDLMRTQKTFLHRKVPTVGSPKHLATVDSIVLPNDAKAATILRAVPLAGTATPQELVYDGFTGTAPATLHCAVAPNGDIIFLAADAWTSVDVYYEAEKQDILKIQLPVVASTGVMAIPTAIGKLIKTIVDVTLDVGTTTGQGIVIVPGNAVPTVTKQVNLNLAKTQVQFRIADAVTLATVTLGLIPAIDVDALLGGDPGGIL